MNILLIDSSSEEHTIFELAVRRLGIDAQYFGTDCCEDALDRLARREIPVPNFIFLDIDMPVVDGYACLKMLKSASEFAGIPVIVYSTTDQFIEIAYMLNHGATFNLNKSRSFVTFCKELKEIIQQDVR